jgi:hypothetical protein
MPVGPIEMRNAVAKERTLARGDAIEVWLENWRAHAEGFQFSFHFALEFSRAAFALDAELFCSYEEIVEGAIEFRFGLMLGNRDVFDFGDFGA